MLKIYKSLKLKTFSFIPTNVLVNFLWIMFAILDIKPTHLHITKHLLHYVFT